MVINLSLRSRIYDAIQKHDMTKSLNELVEAIINEVEVEYEGKAD